jgi:hypothetical protein
MTGFSLCHMQTLGSREGIPFQDLFLPKDALPQVLSTLQDGFLPEFQAACRAQVSSACRGTHQGLLTSQ